MRPRHARIRLLLIALLLLTQWLGRPAHALAMAAAEAAGSGLSVVICGPDGLHSVTLGADGRATEDGSAGKALHQLDCCDLCFQAQADRPAGPLLAGPALRWTILAPRLPQPRFTLAAPRAPPQQPRAPPAA